VAVSQSSCCRWEVRAVHLISRGPNGLVHLLTKELTTQSPLVPKSQGSVATTISDCVSAPLPQAD